jgi:hypothetical protein
MGTNKNMKPKTVKSFLKMCIAICDTDRNDLRGINRLSEDDYMILGNIRAGIQNDLGENDHLLGYYNLKREN